MEGGSKETITHQPGLPCGIFLIDLWLWLRSSRLGRKAGFVIVLPSRRALFELETRRATDESSSMSDVSSSTPSLTPQSTGTQDSSPRAHIKKARPQASFYPNVNAANKEQKPFSRSAAKRESVMALGSIEHLQHYFTKTGLIAKKESKAQRKGLVPAIGSLNTHAKGTPSLSSLPELELPPSPTLPPQPVSTFTPYVKTFEVDPENLRPGVTHDLSVVEDVWRFNANDSVRAPDPSLLSAHAPPTSGALGGGGGGFDVLRALKVTTHAIRSVRNYLLSLPDEHGVSRSRPRQSFRPASLSTSEPQKRRVSTGSGRNDPVARIRSAALDVLTVLRELEESARVPLSDDAYDAGSDRSAQSGVASPAELSDAPNDVSFSVSVMRVGGWRESILVWDEEEDDFNVDEESERVPRERWDERLVLGSGWLYKQDIKVEELEKQQDAVAHYLDTVDEVLFGGRKRGVRGWASEQEGRGKGRRTSGPLPDPNSTASTTDAVVSGGSSRHVASVDVLDVMQDLALTEEEPETLQTLAEEEVDGDLHDDDASSVDDNALPRWAQRSAFPEGELERTHALLIALLPAFLLQHLPTSPDRAKILNALSSGQLLCIAYNFGVRQSRKPWGYINDDSIHDIVALEDALSVSGADGSQTETGRKGWTFRRTDNLRLWGAALRLRYMLPIVSPATPDVPTTLRADQMGAEPAPASRSAATPKTSDAPFFFDARVVARRGDGWEDMLERTLLRWTSAVVEERRNHSG
ncbi:hypothetical protein F5148DRAFT_1215302 [Russula earlei]|uniref:Uncharacterized protein n=1 Tax=Russula earlei TaxID=71964 RepID=A0ACC0U3J8_9AGAM|nr:hypothetical protein F5148DRAFT_1215302 [Russula earlei]